MASTRIAKLLNPHNWNTVLSELIKEYDPRVLFQNSMKATTKNFDSYSIKIYKLSCLDSCAKCSGFKQKQRCNTDSFMWFRYWIRKTLKQDQVLWIKKAQNANKPFSAHVNSNMQRTNIHRLVQRPSQTSDSCASPTQSLVSFSHD